MRWFSRASVSDCSIPRLCCYDYHFYSNPPPHLSKSLPGSFCYRPPSVVVVVVAPLIYTRSPPPFLARNAIHLDVAHTHPRQPPPLVLRSAPRACVCRRIPRCSPPRCCPRPEPRSLSTPGGSPATGPSYLCVLPPSPCAAPLPVIF